MMLLLIAEDGEYFSSPIGDALRTRRYALAKPLPKENGYALLKQTLLLGQTLRYREQYKW